MTDTNATLAASTAITYNGSILNAIGDKVAEMAKGGYELIAMVAWAYVEGTYWVQGGNAKLAREKVHGDLIKLAYRKTAKYDLANAGLAVAQAWVKRFGSPKAGTDRNVFWTMLIDAINEPVRTLENGDKVDVIADTVATLVGAIKADWGIKDDNIQSLYYAINPDKAGNKTDKTITEKVTALVEKADDAEKAAIAMAMVPNLGQDNRVKVAMDAIGNVSDERLQEMFLAINAEMARRAAIVAKADGLAPTAKAA